MTRRATRWSARAAVPCTDWVTLSVSVLEEQHRLPARCGSNCCRKARLFRAAEGAKPHGIFPKRKRTRVRAINSARVIAGRAKASPANRRKANHGNRERTAKSLDAGFRVSRKTQCLDRVETWIARPLPALRRAQIVARLFEGRRPLLGLRARFHPAPRRRSSRLSGDRHCRPHRSADDPVGRDGLFAAGAAAARDLSATHAGPVVSVAATGEGRRRRGAMGDAHAWI